MPQSGQVTAASHHALLALSLLRLGTDTLAARCFREALLPGLLAGDAPGPVHLEQLADLIGLSGVDRAMRIGKARAAAEVAMTRGADLDLRLLTLLDADYPALLRQIVDPPLALWVRGDAGAFGAPAVAIVGSRQSTPTGREVARRFGRGLAEAGLVVVSGLARGIDAAAHQGALETGRTVAILGNGVDRVYPSEHVGLAAGVQRSGALVSEFPPGSRPFASHFPLRNRIISGCVRAVVVVEASERSGSLITARMALEQGRDVLAVPGNVLSGCYRGSHALIKDGARLVETVDEILDEVGWSVKRPQPWTECKSLTGNWLSSFIGQGLAFTIDELSGRSGRSVADCLAELAVMEVAGIVARRPGGVFVKLDGPATNRER